MAIRLLIADDHEVIRAGLRSLFTFQDNGGKSLPGPLIDHVDIFLNYGRSDKKHQALSSRRDPARATIALDKVQL